jgi:hypothetical protein
MLVLSRFELYNTQLLEYLSIKTLMFQSGGPRIDLSSFKVSAGLYKPAALFVQHTLILASIAGLAPITKSQVHGKRKRRTHSLTVDLYGKRLVWPFYDKFLHGLVPFMSEFSVLKTRKGPLLNSTKSLNIRLRKKLGAQQEFSGLVNLNMQDTYRGIYLPLTISLVFKESIRYSLLENYLRMVRLPLVLFRRSDVHSYF